MTEKPTEDQMVRVLAERGMGWRIVPPKSGEFKHCLTFVSSEAEPSEGFHESRCYYPQPPSCVDADSFDPFTSISDAFMLVEKMREKGWYFNLNSPMMGAGWVAQFLKSNDFHRPRWIVGCNSEAVDISSDVRVWNFKVQADTPCRAIALAAFAALEGK